jgi:hypothetical protein
MKEGTNGHLRDPDEPLTDRLHPAVYTTLIGTVLWFVVAIWGFASDRYTDWLLVVVSGFALIAVGIPLILSRVGRDDEHVGKDTVRFRDWVAGDFASWTGRSKAANAAVEILLPLGAIAVGMTAIAIVFLAEHAA